MHLFFRDQLAFEDAAEKEVVVHNVCYDGGHGDGIEFEEGVAF